MIIDTSAIIAILLDEPESRLFFETLSQRSIRFIAAPTLVEATIVAKTTKGMDVLPRLEQLMRDLEIKVLAFGSDHAHAAKLALIKYGKGQGQPAKLNFGDCMSYAASKVEAMPLLFKGGDFRLTDVECAI